MAVREKKKVDSNAVREWANETGWRDELNRPVADRGRMPSGLIEAYNRANARFNREYVPIPRPVRADYRDQAASDKAAKNTARASSRSTEDTPAPRRSTAKASAPAAVVSAPVEAVASDEAEVREMEAALAAFAALPSDKKNGRPVIVKTTITALRYV